MARAAAHPTDGRRRASHSMEAVLTEALTLFDAIVDRPWLGAYFMRNTDVQDSSLRLYERLGSRRSAST